MLFDANLSPRLTRAVVDVFPDAVDVFDCGEIHDDDHMIWAYALQNGFTIITKDGDFQSLSVVRGGPPKVIWLRVGNADSRSVEQLLRNRIADVVLFDTDRFSLLLILDL